MIRDQARLDHLLQRTRRWVRERAMPSEDIVAERDEVPAELVQEMRENGFFGWSIPEQHGGSGLTTEGSTQS